MSETPEWARRAVAEVNKALDELIDEAVAGDTDDFQEFLELADPWGLALALIQRVKDAEQAQMERDCAAVCPGCADPIFKEPGYAHFCKSYPIRTAWAATHPEPAQ